VENKRGQFDWEGIYKTHTFDELGWHYTLLDPDLENALEKSNEKSGTFLDIGSGTGTQTFELYKRGFTVTGIDISKTAIEKASQLYDQIEFIRDDILNPILSRDFDYILDRGCFHNLHDDLRKSYVNSVQRLMKPKGRLFLKCFTTNPEIDGGPYQFSKEMICQLFDASFVIETLKNTVYQGQMKKDPQALFVEMKLK